MGQLRVFCGTPAGPLPVSRRYTLALGMLLAKLCNYTQVGAPGPRPTLLSG